MKRFLFIVRCALLVPSFALAVIMFDEVVSP
jgi:hypothetical protein